MIDHIPSEPVKKARKLCPDVEAATLQKHIIQTVKEGKLEPLHLAQLSKIWLEIEQQRRAMHPHRYLKAKGRDKALSLVAGAVAGSASAFSDDLPATGQEPTEASIPAQDKLSEEIVSEPGQSGGPGNKVAPGST